MTESKIKKNSNGFSDFFKKQLETVTTEGLCVGRVVEVHKNLYKLLSDGKIVAAKLKGSFMYHIKSEEDFPAIGDFVLYKSSHTGDSIITKVLERKTVFIRADLKGHKETYVKTIHTQVIAANFDYVFIMVSLNHDLNINRINRYVSITRQSKATPVIILTKADLCENYREKIKMVKEVVKDIEVVAVSIYQKVENEVLSGYFVPGNTIAFLGSSGVGKSSFLNMLAGSELMKVNTIREDDSKGRHTTSHRQVFTLDSGAMVIDTPGLRELGLIDVEEGIDQTFKAIKELEAQCKFNNCTHQNEPGCMVMEAIKCNRIDQKYYETYLNFLKEVNFTKNKSAAFSSKKR